MNDGYVKTDPWRLVEDRFDPSRALSSESLFALGNGVMGGRANFEERYESEGPQAATDWFYKFSQDTDYIRRYRIKRDLKWVTKTPYGDLDITINLSKPEKDPKAIAAAKLAPQSAYPKCQLCAENEGYAGRMNHPARENHRIIPLTIWHSTRA